jgi:septum formation protein
MVMSESNTTPGRLPRVHLASRSPRRRELLAGVGIEHDAAHPGLDDAQLDPGAATPEEWVAALAYLKAKSALAKGDVTAPVVLGADTVVVKDGHIISSPVDESDARTMLRSLRDGEHDVLTGVALVRTDTGDRELFVDKARVRVGHLSDEVIEKYLQSGGWRGKAGGYNLSERLADGWPIDYQGDPGTIMGLPVRALVPRLAGFASR